MLLLFSSILLSTWFKIGRPMVADPESLALMVPPPLVVNDSLHVLLRFLLMALVLPLFAWWTCLLVWARIVSAIRTFKLVVLFEWLWWLTWGFCVAIVAPASALDLEFADMSLILCLLCSIKLIRQVLALVPEFGLVVEDSFNWNSWMLWGVEAGSSF